MQALPAILRALSSGPLLLGVLWLAGCGASSDDADTGGASEPADTSGGDALPEPSPAATSPAAVNMQRHFADVQTARDAIISGDLDAYRAAMTHIADARYGADFPPDWHTWVAQMQRVARDSADVLGVGEAAQAIAALGTQCGSCHRDTAGGPDVPEETTPPEELSQGAVLDQMHRHAWATDQLWIGLTAPSHTAWVRGARAIADPGETRGTALGASLTSLQEYAARASLANRTNREEMYAEILSRCASCHISQGRGGS